MKGRIGKQNNRRQERNRLRGRFKPRGGQRIEWLKQAKAQFDAKKLLRNKTTRPKPRKRILKKPINHPKVPLDEKLMEFIRKKDIKGVKKIQDILCRRLVYRNETITGKEGQAMDAAKKFLREVDSLAS